MAEIDLAAAVQREYLGTWRKLGELAERGEVEPGPPLCVASGAPIAFFNQAFFTEPSSDPQADFDSVDLFFGARDLPYAVVFRDGVDPSGEDHVREMGFAKGEVLPGMALHPLGELPPAPTGLHVEEATTPEQHSAFLALVAESFGMPLDILAETFTFELAQSPGISELMGFESGRPVAGAMVSVTDGIAGLYNVVTTPGARGRGLGAYMTWSAIEVGRTQGCDIATLQSSKMGLGVYRRMGFQEVSKYNVYLKDPDG